jgi:outer membrane protein assembly factor BamB
MRVPRSSALLLSPVAFALALSACGGSSSAGPSPGTRTLTAASAAATAPAATWPTYHGDAARTGVASGLPAAGQLSVAWKSRLDGAVYGQPLIVGGLVIAATENDTVYALDMASGTVRWRSHVGTPVPLASLPCGDIDPLGITGTPVYDQADGLVYAVAETAGYHHVLFGFSITDGSLQVARDIPAPDNQPRYDQQRAALTIENGDVYVAFGGLDGDCGPYIGSVVGMPVTGGDPLLSYRVPTAREGGIWATGGPVTDSRGTVYVSVGNGAASGPPFDGSDSVTALAPSLTRLAIFAPGSWAADNANDLDLGSMSPAVLPDGTILAVGKRGTGYLLKASHLGGVGGQVTQAPVCTAFGGPAVSGSMVYVPCDGGGLAAVNVAGSQIRILWRGPATAAGSPVIGGGAVWVADWGSGTLYELDQATGSVRHQISLGSSLPHFASPSLSGGLVFIGTMGGVVAVRGA